MKVCYCCGKEKSLFEFSKNKAKKDGLSAQCKECHKSLRRDHYEKNKKKIIRQVRDWKLGYREWWHSLKDNKPCTDCGNVYPHYVMDWDHLKDKNFSISEGVYRNWSKEKVLMELDKCELVCSNCHRKRTYIRLKAPLV